MKHLTVAQRYTISVMKQKGYTQKQISELIGKDKSTISRELRRNCDGRSKEYRHDLAQRKCDQRHHTKPKKVRFTEQIREYVDILLRKDYSPEQIVGVAKRYNMDCVSHERIYQYIWADKKAKGSLFTHLRRKGRRYRKRGAAKDSRGIIKDRIDISQRPAIVNEKTRLGDLEIDTIIGKNHQGAILTINDRVSSYLWMAKLNGKNADELAIKAVEILKKMLIGCIQLLAIMEKNLQNTKKLQKPLTLIFISPNHTILGKEVLMKTQTDLFDSTSLKVFHSKPLLMKRYNMFNTS